MSKTRLSTVCLILILISACASSPPALLPTETPSETPTSTPRQTETPAPASPSTSTPTEIPSPTEEPPPLEIVIDTNPEKLPSLSWDYITSEQFMKDLLEMDRRGLLPEVPDTAIPLSIKNPIVYIPDSATIDSVFIKNHGYANLFTISNEMWRYTAIDKRPWVFIGVWTTEFDGVPCYVYIIKWENLTGTNGFLGNFASARSAMSLSDGLIETMDALSNEDLMPTGDYFTGEKGCNEYMSYFTLSASTICNWYFTHQDISKAPDIFRNWAQTGILKDTFIGSDNNEKVFLPFAPSGFRRLK